MREIKFRGKRIDNNEWVYGSYVYYGEKDRYFIVRWNENLKNTPVGRFQFYEVFPETVGQFMGETDINNKEIYEGDIVNYKYGERFCEDEENPSYVKSYRDIIVFKNGEFSPHSEMVYCEDCWYSYKYFNLEVIGNIFDNPELRGGKK